MAVSLEKAQLKDAEELFGMQLAAFTPLLEKYRDFATSPANEPIERMKARILELDGGFYKIVAGKTLVGAIRIRQKENLRFWIGPLFIAPCFQGRGMAQCALAAAEKFFPQAVSWHLDTLLEEQGNCHLYEKMGYKRVGAAEKLNLRTTLVHYEKHQAER